VIVVIVLWEIKERVDMVDWAKFTAALAARGISFDKVRFASNRVALINAVGFIDPLDVSVIETEWESRSRAAVPTDPAGRSDRYGASQNQAVPPPRPNFAIADPTSKAMGAADYSGLRTAPEELQETVVASEVLHVLRGYGGSLIAVEADGSPVISPLVPETIASLIASVVECSTDRKLLERIERLEMVDHRNRSRVKNAIAEAVREIDQQYVRDVSALAERSRQRALPIARLVAEAHRVCYPIRRLAQVFDHISGQQQKAIEEITGEVLLNELHLASLAAAGNEDDSKLLGFIVRRAATPYIGMLGRWMYRGELDDPYGEFFVVAATKPPRQADALSAFMDRYACAKSRVPRFLEPVYRLAFHAGRYCMLLRESSGTLPQIDDADKKFEWGNSDAIDAVVRRIHDAASKEVMSVLVTRCKLMEKFESLKLYFLHGRGDWLENFLEASQDMLARATGQVKTYTLNVVLQAEIAKSCAHDPNNSNMRFALSDYTLTDVVSRIRAADPTMQQVIASSENVRHSVRRSVGAAAIRQDARQIVELMQLQVETDWLLSLVINAPFVAKLNIIFRLLLWCKLCERDLNDAWWRSPHNLPRGTSLRLKMLQFVRQYFFYAVHHVLDPAWHALMDQVTSAVGIREVSAHVSTFCDEAFRGLAIKSEHAFKSLSAILRLIQRFADLGRQPVRDEARRVGLSAKVAQYDEEFMRLLSALGNPNERDYGKLVPLLSWLDFSGYYGRQGVYHVRAAAAAHDELLHLADTMGSRRSESGTNEFSDSRATSTHSPVLP
jgi:gamma-tubulin complex component 2